MQLVEQHVIDRSDPRYSVIDEAAFKSKNLYNAGNYEIRQSYIHTGKYLNYNEMDRRMQSREAYKALPAKVSQQVLKQLDHDWDAFFKARAGYKEDPSKFKARPKIPGYKHKTEGRNMLVYTIQAISQGKDGLKRGMIKPSMLAIEVRTKQKDINQVRIVPRKGFYVVEAVYEQEVKQMPVNPAYYAGIDIGMNNLVALTSNKPGFRSVLVNGRPVSAIRLSQTVKRGKDSNGATSAPMTTKSPMMGVIPIPLDEERNSILPGSDWSSIREAGGNGAELQTRCNNTPSKLLWLAQANLHVNRRDAQQAKFELTQVPWSQRGAWSKTDKDRGRHSHW